MLQNEWQSNILDRLYQIMLKIIILSWIGADIYQKLIFEIPCTFVPPWRTVHSLHCSAFTMQLDSLKNTDKRQFKCKKKLSNIYYNGIVKYLFVCLRVWKNCKKKCFTSVVWAVEHLLPSFGTYFKVSIKRPVLLNILVWNFLKSLY